MCMYLDKKATREFQAKIREAGGTISCWRRYCRRGGHLYPLWFGADSPIGPGDIFSNREHRAAGRDSVDKVGPSYTIVNRGIHVNPCRGVARWDARVNEVVVKVRCQLKDLVGAGDLNDAVFTKVHLSKRSYAAAMRSA